MHPSRVCLLSVVVVALVLRTYAGYEPIGNLKLLSLYVNDLSEENTTPSSHMRTYLKCSTQSRVSKTAFQTVGKSGSKRLAFPDGENLRISLLSHESVECELMEKLKDKDEASRGLCEYTYARFLAPKDNIVTCNLSDGSSFVLRLVCPKACPTPVSGAAAPYCRPSKKLQTVGVGKSHSFSDGSPGFALYASNSECSWTIPRTEKGTTNFLFTRLDLGSGDSVEAYSSNDGEKETFLKKYTTASVPESVATSEKFLILKFVSDGKDEGLGFAGFYYYTAELLPPVAIVPRKETEGDKSSASTTKSGSRKDFK